MTSQPTMTAAMPPVSANGPPARLEPRLDALAQSQHRALSGIRGRLLSGARGKEVRSILVTSGLGGEGKTTIAVTLAMSLARTSDAPVLLMDGNHHSPALHDLFQIPAAPGVSEMVLQNLPVEQAIWSTETPNLYVAPWGGEKVYGTSVLDPARFRPVVEGLRSRFGYVVMDSAAVLATPDALLAAPAFDGAIEVIRCERTRRDVPPAVKHGVETAGGMLLGVVLNRRRYYLPRLFYKRV